MYDEETLDNGVFEAPSKTCSGSRTKSYEETLYGKNILIISTGGTILSVDTDEGKRPGYKAEELVNFFPEVKKLANIEGMMVYGIDSTNIYSADWPEIAKALEDNWNKYDGFVILHGTDTMAYTGAALSFMVQNPDKPVVITGSESIVGQESDAGPNLVGSVVTACSDVHDVCVYFHGKIIKASRLKKTVSEATEILNYDVDVFSSVNYPYIGRIVDDAKYGRKIMLDERYVPKKHDDEPKFFPKIERKATDIDIVELFPGFDPEKLDRLADSKAVIIKAYGSGNTPFRKTQDYLATVAEKIEMLTKMGIPVLVTTQVPFGAVDMSIYEVGRKAVKAGAISCYDMTPEAAVTKLMWIFANFGKDYKTVKELMLRNFADEIKTI